MKPIGSVGDQDKDYKGWEDDDDDDDNDKQESDDLEPTSSSDIEFYEPLHPSTGD